MVHGKKQLNCIIKVGCQDSSLSAKQKDNCLTNHRGICIGKCLTKE